MTVQPLWQLCDALPKTCRFQTSAQLCIISLLFGHFCNDFSDCDRQNTVLLKHSGKETVIQCPIIRPNIHAIIQNLPFCRVYQPANQFYKRCFARTVYPHYCQMLGRLDFEIDAAQHILLRAFIAVADITKLNDFGTMIRRDCCSFLPAISFWIFQIRAEKLDSLAELA